MPAWNTICLIWFHRESVNNVTNSLCLIIVDRPHPWIFLNVLFLSAGATQLWPYQLASLLPLNWIIFPEIYLYIKMVWNKRPDLNILNMFKFTTHSWHLIPSFVNYNPSFLWLTYACVHSFPYNTLNCGPGKWVITQTTHKYTFSGNIVFAIVANITGVCPEDFHLLQVSIGWRPKQNGLQSADDISRIICFSKNCDILILMSLKRCSQVSYWQKVSNRFRWWAWRRAEDRP